MTDWEPAIMPLAVLKAKTAAARFFHIEQRQAFSVCFTLPSSGNSMHCSLPNCFPMLSENLKEF